MPELPEVETVKSAIEDVALHSKVTGVWKSELKMRWAIPHDLETQIMGDQVQYVGRRGKYILIDLEKNNHHRKTLILHLGMSGSVRIYPENDIFTPMKHDHLILSLSGREGVGNKVVLNDPRRFGGVQLTSQQASTEHPLLKDMGIEPLGNAMNAGMLMETLKARKAPIKAVLLDQKVIAGIGNIYASEALYMANISPLRAAQNLNFDELTRLCMAIRTVLEKAILQGGTSLRDYVQPGGEIGYFKHELSVYGRGGDKCYNCAKEVQAIKQSGRMTFYCPNCQK